MFGYLRYQQSIATTETATKEECCPFSGSSICDVSYGPGSSIIQLHFHRDPRSRNSLARSETKQKRKIRKFFYRIYIKVVKILGDCWFVHDDLNEGREKRKVAADGYLQWRGTVIFKVVWPVGRKMFILFPVSQVFLPSFASHPNRVS